MLYFRFAYLSCLRAMLASCGIKPGTSAHLTTNQLVPNRNLIHLKSDTKAFSSIQENKAATFSGPLDGF